MIETISKLLAIIALLAFFGVLLWHVPRLDLGAIIAVSLALVGWDFITSRNG